MNIFISIVSHGHDSMIMTNSFLKEISSLNDVYIGIKDNICSEELRIFCSENNFHYIGCKSYSGFGMNNNIVYDYFSPNPDDWFLVINPDVIITKDQMECLISYLKLNCDKSLYCINLFKDVECQESENSIRKFPTLACLLNVFRGKSINIAYDKSNLNEGDVVDWASGAFLIFRSSLYKKLNGFDVAYHMYYEDVDICFRASRNFNERLRFIKVIHAVHNGAYQNRNIFSKHFKWYLASLLRFLYRKSLWRC